jgi:hypothetical protein
MLGFFKRRLFRKMVSYVNGIQVGVFYKLCHSSMEAHGEEHSDLVAAATINRLFGKPVSPKHSENDLKAAEQVAVEILREDDEVRYAALMSLRTMMTIESERKNLSGMQRIVDTIDWMQHHWQLPTDSPEPELMRSMANLFYAKYSPERQSRSKS